MATSSPGRFSLALEVGREKPREKPPHLQSQEKARALGTRLMKWQIIVRLKMVFRFLCKVDCKKVNWAEQIAMKRWKISHELKEF